MRYLVAAILIPALFLCGGRAAASVEIAPLGASERKVEANGYYTVGFVAVSRGEPERRFIIAVEPIEAAVLISALDPIILKPGAPVKFALTFSISGGVKDGQVIPAGVSVTAADDPSISARASVNMVVELKDCAVFGDLPGSVDIINGKAADVLFTLTNCGSGKEKFDIRVEPDYGVELRTRAQPAELNPGESKSLRFSIAPTNSAASYASSVRIRIMKNETPVTETALPVSVKLTKSPQTHSGYQYIPLTLSLENSLYTRDNLRTSLRISVPQTRDGATTFKSDVWMDSDGADVETRQRQYDISHGNTRMLFGNQPVALPKVIHNSVANYEGSLLSQTFGSAAVTFFRGGSAANRVTLVRWERAVNLRFRVGLGRLSESNHIGEFSRLTADTVDSSYAVNRRVTLNTEVTRYNVTGVAPRQNWSGAGFRIGGGYQSAKLQMNGFTQTGRRNVSVGDYFKGTEFRLDYDINKSRRVFVDLRRSAAYDTRNFNAGLEFLDRRRNIKNSSIGYSQPFYAGVKLFASMRFSSYNVTAGGASAAAPAIRDNSATLRLSRNFSSLNLNAEIKDGRRSDFIQSYGYREYGVSGMYSRKSIRIGLDVKNLFQSDGASSGNARPGSRTWTAAYTPPNNRRSFQIWWRRDAEPDYLGESDVRKRFEFRFQNRFKNGDTVRFSYSAQSFQGVDDDTVSVAYSKNATLKIPYKKYGSVTGTVFEDRNRDGRYGGGDVPVKNAVVLLGKDLRAKSDGAGVYEVFDVAQGLYPVTVDPASIPAYLSRAAGSGDNVKVKSGKRAEADIPFQRIFRIKGMIVFDNSDVLSAFNAKETSRLKIILAKGGRAVDSAYSDDKGLFYFEGISAGEYEVSLDPAWLPEGAVCRGGDKRAVAADGNSDVTGVTFIIEPKRVETIKTFEGR